MFSFSYLDSQTICSTRKLRLIVKTHAPTQDRRSVTMERERVDLHYVAKHGQILSRNLLLGSQDWSLGSLWVLPRCVSQFSASVPIILILSHFFGD